MVLHSAFFGLGLPLFTYVAALLVWPPCPHRNAALSIANSAGGAVKAIRTTPLMTGEEGVEAMREVGRAGGAGW